MKFLLFILTASLSLSFYAPANTVQKESYLEKSSSREESVKLQLPNGLEALLISDPTLTSSGATLSVAAGAWHSPRSSLGLPHFIEHMIFLGSEQYPEEQSFSQFINKNGGEQNAFTADLFTSYYFTIASSEMEEALSRFSALFTAPLFSEGSLQRERMAIDQEHAKNFGNDSRRTRLVQKELSDSSHPHHYFTTGNKETLAKVSSSELRKWWEQYYGAEKMRLVVYSSLPLHALKKIITNDFGKIPLSKNNSFSTEKKEAAPSPFSPLEGKIVYIEPSIPITSLQLHWLLPAALSSNQGGTAELAALLKATYPGNLADLLEQEGLATALSVRHNWFDFNQKSFCIEIFLTNKGVQHVQKVIERVFEQIALFKSETVPNEILESLHKVASLHAAENSKEKELFSLLEEHAETVPFEKLEDYLSSSSTPFESNPSAIKELAASLSASHAHYFLVAPSHISAVNSNRTEKWLGARYSVKDLSSQLLNRWDTLKPGDAKLPPPNPFLPKKEDFISEQPEKSEAAFIENDYMKIYWEQSESPSPYLIFQLEITSPLLERTVSGELLPSLVVKNVQKKLKNIIAQAKEAGNQITIRRGSASLSIEIVAYHSIASKLLELIFNNLTALPTEKEFYSLKGELTSTYEHAYKESAIGYTRYISNLLTDKQNLDTEEKKALLKKVSYEQFSSFIKNYLNSYFVFGTVYGGAQEAIEPWSQKMSALLPGAPYALLKKEKRITGDADLAAPAETFSPLFVWNSFPTVGNGLLLLVQEPKEETLSEALLAIVMQGLLSHYFDELRTKQQTAYIVESYPFSTRSAKNFAAFSIQSNSFTPEELLTKNEQFLEKYLAGVEKGAFFTAEEFEKIRAALIGRYREIKEEQALSYTRNLHSTLYYHDGNSSWETRKAQELAAVTYSQAKQYLKNIFSKDNKNRLAIATYGLTRGETAIAKGQTTASEPLPPAPYLAVNGVEKARAFLGSLKNNDS